MANQAFRSRQGLVRGLTVLFAAFSAMTGLAACGAPSYNYVADSAANTYFKVPNGWHAVPKSELAQAVGASGVWATAFGEDAATASPGSIDSFSVTKPFVLAEVGMLNSTASEGLSYDSLEDIFLPVTADARSEEQGQYPVTNFKLDSQEFLTPGQGVHGVQVVYQYTYTDGKTDGATDTFDQIALTNADETEVYLLIVHCTTACYSQNQKTIDDITSSFTVRSPL